MFRSTMICLVILGGGLGLLFAGGRTAGTKDKNDTAFIKTADQISLTEIQLGKLAQDHAANAAVKKFGKRLMHDHMVMNKTLRQLTTKKGITIATTLDAKHQKLVDTLTSLKGIAFDQTYTKDMVAGHEKAIKLFQNEAKNGLDPDVRAWAEMNIPTLQEHLKLARATVKQVKGE